MRNSSEVSKQLSENTTLGHSRNHVNRRTDLTNETHELPSFAKKLRHYGQELSFKTNRPQFMQQTAVTNL